VESDHALARLSITDGRADVFCYQEVQTSSFFFRIALMDFDKLSDLSYERTCLMELLMTTLPATQRRVMEKRLSVVLDEMRILLREAATTVEETDEQLLSMRKRRRAGRRRVRLSDSQNGQAVA
jgi:hypothetical protein